MEATELGIIKETREVNSDGERLVEVDATTKVNGEAYHATITAVQPVTFDAMIERWGKRLFMEYAIKSWAIDVKGRVRRAIEAKVGGKAVKTGRKASYVDVLELDD